MKAYESVLKRMKAYKGVKKYSHLRAMNNKRAKKLRSKERQI